MASSALKSALRYTACMRAVYLRARLRLRSTGRRRRSVGNCGETPNRPRSGRAVTSLSGLSTWPSAGAGGTAVSSWRASRTCETAWANALRWDILQSRSLADWRWNMVASSSAMSQSIVSSIIVPPRRIAGIACCRAANEHEGGVDEAPPSSSNSGARSPTAPPRSKAAGRRAIGRPTSCCSPGVAKRCWFFTNDKPASPRSNARPIEKLSALLRPSLVNLANFHRRSARPSASTTETSSPNITDFTKPLAFKLSSAIRIARGKRAGWRTSSGVYDGLCPARLTSSPSHQPISGSSFGASTTPRANAWTSKRPPRHSPNSNQPLRFKRESIPRLRGV